MNPQKMMGYEIPGDQKAAIPIRDWTAMKLALWRSKVAWDIAMTQADEILGQCRHREGCLGADDENEPCVLDRYAAQEDGTHVRVEEGCVDRELRMSALVIVNAGRQFAPAVAHKPADAPYFAPSREYFSEVLASLVAAEAEIEALRATLGEQAPPRPPPNSVAPPSRLAPPRTRLLPVDQPQDQEST
jgi:hypothetical protein